MEEKEKKRRILKNKKTPDTKIVSMDSEVKEIFVEKKVGFNYLEVILIMIITLIVGGFLGNFITELATRDKKNPTSINSNDELESFVDAYNDIKNNYYQDIDEDALLNAGIKGMIEFLGDTYSVYMDEEETDSFNEQVDGSYEGIGVEIIGLEDNSVIVLTVFEDSPAANAGLLPGDIIKEVGDEDVTGRSSEEIASRIKKHPSKDVVITVLRGEELLQFTVERKTIELESVASTVFESNGKKVGYLSVSIFAANTYKQFSTKLEELENQDIQGLVIDVRSNSGGYLNSVTDIASIFLSKGSTIYQLDTKGIVEKILDETKEERDYPISVIINKGSASAAEILAAALKESYDASVVGVASFGKGTVQRAYRLDTGATVKYTIQKWLTPKGNWINQKGVDPTSVVELTDEYYNNPIDSNDDQLQEALKLVSE